MATKIHSALFIFVLCCPLLGLAETQWRSEALGLQCLFPTYWEVESLPSQGDLAKGGTLVRAERTPGLPAGVRFELELEPLAIALSPHEKALTELLDSLRGTPKLQVLKSELRQVSDQVSELKVRWKIAQSRHTLESLYRLYDVGNRRYVASVSGRLELVEGIRDELSLLWDSIRAE